MSASRSSAAGDCTVRNGSVITAGGRARADLVIEDGVVTAIGAAAQRRGREIDATGMLVLPGAVDIHTHIDTAVSPDVRSADDWYSGTVAAACGGVTTVIDYVRQEVGESLVAMMSRWEQRAAPRAVVDYGFHAVPMQFDDNVLTEIPALVAAGYPSVKIFMSRVPDDEMAMAMSVLASCEGTAMVHAEDQALKERAYDGRSHDDSPESKRNEGAPFRAEDRIPSATHGSAVG